MTRLTSQAQKSITVNGVEHKLNTSYRAALLTWNAFEAVHSKEISPLAAAVVSIDNMLGIDVAQLEENVIDKLLKAIAEYLIKYARTSERGKTDDKPPLLDLEQDATMIYDAFMSMGIDLDEKEVSYPRFMSLLRELPKDAQICRVVYLRQQRRKGKLTKEEKEECNRRGWDVINIKNRKAEREAADNKEYFKNLQNELRAAKGLPPV